MAWCIPYDIVISKFFEKADFPNCSAGNTFILCLKPDFLEGHNMTGGHVACLVDNAVSTCMYQKDRKDRVELPEPRS